MAGNKVVVSVLADTKKFRRAMGELGNETGFTKLAAGAKNLGKALAVATAAVAGISIVIGQKTVEAAAKLEQSIGAIDDVFKTSAGQMHVFAKTAATTAGLSANSYNELATVLGAQLKNGGTAIDQLGAKTNKLIMLGADLAAGFGGSTTDAVNALSSALKGERDPIERYGVSLKQAAIDAKAAELGFKKVGNSFDNSAQQAATLALIMEQTSDMHGKFGRETGTLANQQQVLSAQWENMSATIGSYLIPAITPLFNWLNDKLPNAMTAIKKWIETKAMPAFDKLKEVLGTYLPPAWEKVKKAAQSLGVFITGTLIPAVKNIISKIIEYKDVLIPLGVTIAGIVTGIQAYLKVQAVWGATQKAWAAGTALVTGAQKALNVAMKDNPIGIIITAITTLIGILTTLYATNESFRNKVNEVWDNVKGVILGVWNILKPVFTTFNDIVKTVLVGAFNILKTTVSVVWSAIKTAINVAWNIIKGIFSAIEIALKVLSTAFTASKIAISAVWEAIKYVISTVWGAIKATLNTIMNFLTGIFSGAWNTAKEVAINAFNGLKNGVTGAINAVKNIISSIGSKISSWIGNPLSFLRNAGAKIIDGFINGITSGFNAVKRTLKKLTSWLPDWKGPAKHDATILTNAGELVISGFVKGLENSYPEVRKTLTGLTKQIPSYFGQPKLKASLDFNPTNPDNPPANQIVINIQALTPTPEIGRQVVNAIKEYEKLAGRR